MMLRKSELQYLFVSLVLLLSSGLYAQSLSYTGTNQYNITAPEHIDENFIPSFERAPTGMTFGDSGNKFYMVGSQGDFVVQFALSTAYDATSKAARPEAVYRVNAEDGTPEDVAFNDDGTRMYIVGGVGDDITQYTLSTAWDVSSIDTGVNPPVVFDARTAIENLLGATNGDRLTGMAFNNDGSKIYVVDRRSDDVFEFDLSTAYDISTAGAVVNNLPTTGESNPRGIAFNNDGTELYVIGNQGDDVNTFTLSVAYDLSSSTGSTNSVQLTEDTVPQAILLNDDGTTFYVAGSNDDEINEYTLGTAYDFSSTITQVDSFIAQTVEINPRDLTFNADGTKLFVAGDQLNIVTELALTTAYDVSTAGFTVGLFVGNEETNIRGLTFNNTGTVLYIVGSNGDEINVYTLGAAYDLTSSITASGPFSVLTQDNNPNGIAFSNDGTKLFISGNQGNDINQYTLSPAYDLSTLTADHDGSLNISGLDTAPQGIAFNDDGSKFFFLGNDGNDINEYTLSNNFDLLSGTVTNTNNFSIASQETSPTGITFNGDGNKLYVCGNNGDDINQYQTKGFLPETSTNNGTIDVSTPLVITLTGDTFADVDADNLLDVDTEFTIANLPAGLTPIFTLSGADTVATLTFSGTANSHIDSDEAAANMSFTFLDAAFTTSNAADVTFAVAHTNVMGFDFIECPSNEIVYNGSWSGGSGAGGAPDETDDALGIRIENDVTITANFDCTCLHVNAGVTLSTATGVQATVSDALELDGDLRLLGTSQLIQTHTGTKNASGPGDLYKDRMGTLTNVYQIGYWTSPVTTNGSTYTISGVLKDGTTALTASNTPGDIVFSTSWDGSTSPVTISTRWLASFLDNSVWTEQIGETSTLNPGEGFTKKSTGNGSGQNYTFVGRPNGGEYTHTIGAYGSGRWSLLGNPYPSPINADTFITDNATTATSIVGTLYFYEAGNDTSHTTSEYLGGYASRTFGMGSPAAELGMAGKTPGQYIGIGQGFFIEASAGGGTVTFNNALRVFDPSDTNTEYFGRNNNATASSSASFPILRIGFEFDLNGETYHRQLVTGFDGLTNNYENGHEAEMWDYKSSDLALKVDDRSTPFVITTIEDFDTSLEIPLKLRLDQERAVSFMVDETEGLSTDIYLKDAITNFYYNITNNSQEITMPAGTYDDRFFITFTNSALSTDDIALNKLISVFSQEENITIKSNSLQILKAAIYTILGQKIQSSKNQEDFSEFVIPTHTMRTGVYIIKVYTDKGMVTKKVVVN